MSEYPSESWPSDVTIQALNGLTDDATGLPFVAQGVNPNSTPSLRVQFHRMQERLARIVEQVCELRVVQVGALAIGVFPGRFTIRGTAYAFAGDASLVGADGVAFSDGDDIYYLWIDATNAIRMATDATGWPADGSTCVPLAMVTVVSSAITAIVDVRNYRRLGTWQPYDADLAAVAGLSASGMIARTGAGMASARTVTAGVGLAVTNGDGVSGNPTIARVTTVEPHASTPVNLAAADVHKLLTNEGATAQIVVNLPAAAANLEVEGYVQDADGIKFVAAAGDTIRIEASVSPAAGYISSTTVGSAVRLVAINATEWVAVSFTGTWSVST